jgi:hypothetical protein
MIDALEVGHWRLILRPRPPRAGRRVAGPVHLVRWGVVLRLVAVSMQLQARGRVQEAWERLGEAAVHLPVALRRLPPAGDVAVATLVPAPPSASPDEELARRIARLVWREQYELLHLRNRFAPGLMRPRDQLVDACIEHMCWGEFDPFASDVPRASTWDDGVTLANERSVLCRRGSRLRQFADPTKGDISKSVWIDVGEYRGLRARALERLADRPAPAPWWEAPGTADLRVRLGQLRAWQHARTWRDDLGCWS